MKKTVRTVDMLGMFFLMCAWAFMYEGLEALACLAVLAAILCVGISLGSIACDFTDRVRSRRRGGE